MNTAIEASDRARPQQGLSPLLTFLFAATCGLVAANLYYAQPLAGPISQELGMSPAAAGLIVTLTQIGYGLGLLFIVPLGDLLENRKLILTLILVAAVALMGASFSTTSNLFLMASLAIGLASVAVQVVVPFAAGMAPDHSRGRVVGNVMSGLMVGIMLARPFSSFLSEFGSWRTVYVVTSIAMVALALILRFNIPVRKPVAHLGYGGLLASMGRLALTERVLQRRALYQAGMFAAFSLFWTTSPMLLASPAFGFSQNGIALFALAGAAGAVASPIAGRLADRGYSRPATIAAMIAVMASFAIASFGTSGSALSIFLVTASAILLDFAVTTSLVCGQRAIYALSAENRGRLNGLFMATFFCGGAIGSALGGWAYATGGWQRSAEVGFVFPFLAFLFLLTEFFKRGKKVPAV